MQDHAVNGPSSEGTPEELPYGAARVSLIEDGQAVRLEWFDHDETMTPPEAWNFAVRLSEFVSFEWKPSEAITEWARSITGLLASAAIATGYSGATA